MITRSKGLRCEPPNRSQKPSSSRTVPASLTDRELQEISLVLVEALRTRNFSLWQEYLNQNFKNIDHAAATLIGTRAAFRMLGVVETSLEQTHAVIADIRSFIEQAAATYVCRDRWGRKREKCT